MNNTKVSFRVTVVGMFVVATILTAIVAVSLQYYFSKKMATEQTLSNLTIVSQQLNEVIGKVDADATNTIQLLSKISRSISHHLSEQEVRAILSEAVKDNDLFYSIYVGSENDDFYQIINLESSPDVRKRLGAKASDRWVVITVRDIDSKRTRKTAYFDEAFNLRAETLVSSNYYPTTRPWYIEAKYDAVSKTDPYLFHHLQVTGQTYSLAFHSKNGNNSQKVIGIDIILSSLADQISASSLGLREDSEVEAFVYSKSGNIIASNKPPSEQDLFPESPKLILTDRQKEIVANASPVLISNQNDWGPLDYSVAGKPNGYAVDVIALISQTTGLEFDFVNGFSWKELANKFVQGDLDALQSAQKQQGSVVDYAKGVYTQPIYELPFSVVTKMDTEIISNYAQLEGKKVAIIAGWSIIPTLRKDFPGVELVEFETLNAAFDSVETGACFAVLDSKPVLSFGLDRLFYSDLKVNSNLIDLGEMYSMDFHIVLSRELADLVPILNLAINNITPAQRSALAGKWFHSQGDKSDNTVPYTELYDMVQSATLSADIIAMTLNGEEKHVYLKEIETGKHYSEYFAVVIPEREIFETVRSRVITSIFITLLLMCLTLPLAWVFGAPIVRPIKQLIVEAEKIQDRRYEEVAVVRTPIKEVWDLSVAIKDMAKELKQHEKTQEEFVESFIKLIAQAIDDKSPYTGGHCHRVPELGMMLADAAEKSQLEQFSQFRFNNDDEKREFRIAAWLHDCGKITTPEHIVDKGSKLEANYNRIHEIRTRFEVLWRDAEIVSLQQRLNGEHSTEQIESELYEVQQQLKQDFEFVANANVGGEFMSEEKVARIKDIASTVWVRHFDDTMGLSPAEESNRGESTSLPFEERLLSDKPEHIIKREQPISFDPEHQIDMIVPEHLYNLGEVYNLTITRGTLTAEDRFKINEHMIGTIKILESIPFPQELSRVPRYASTHHETMKGTGYPRKLKGDELSIPERILVVSDIFEALTASDRPYKTAKPISVAIDIMYKMALDEHIDIETFKLLLSSNAYLVYAQKYLKPEQIDVVDVAKYFPDLT
ncbi:HD domain-containing phosphohydrolase [Vibrio cionasavignyae]|uniref:HD domain-containing phosphohydrolase n=1 Tax=Vibrio cionasavignyae TaxID=2910252 RepID=UPI003D0F03CE